MRGFYFSDFPNLNFYLLICQYITLFFTSCGHNRHTIWLILYGTATDHHQRTKKNNRYGLPNIDQRRAASPRQRERDEPPGAGSRLYAGGRASPCVEKALSLVRHLLDGVKTQVPPLSSIPFKDEKKDDTPADALLMRWTGNLSDFVEMVYGLDSLKCINGGETGVTELLLGFGKLFGLKLKDKQCYNAYADIKRRKSDSRTYFFDKAAEKLNRRMQEDEERERMRKR